MARISKVMGWGLFVLFLTVLGFQDDAAAQSENPDVAGAVKQAQGAGVSPAMLNHLLSLGYTHQTDPKSMAGFIQILTEVKREDLPVEPFASKIEEAMAKRIPSTLTHQVLVKKKEDYRFTQSLMKATLKKHGLDQKIPHQSLERISETLACGVSRETLRHYTESALPSSTVNQLAIALETTASLQQHRFDPQTTREVVMGALKQDYFTSQRKDFSRILIAAKQKGVPEKEIAAKALGAMKNKESVESMATHLGVKAEDLSHGPVTGHGQSQGGWGGRGSDDRGGWGSHGGWGSGSGPGDDGGHGGGGSGGGHGDSGGHGDGGGSGGGGGGGGGGGMY